MLRLAVLFSVIFITGAVAHDDPVVFKSDVSMTRVDAQVLDRNGRPVAGLEQSDFVLLLDGKPVPIRNFASENMPMDILMLIDVSGSMEPHVERIATAAQDALRVLTDKDRVAIMVFDTFTRIRLPFRSSHSEVTSELHRLLRSEGFNGGTRITHAMMSAANYLQKEARPEARRAIVILTDDMTQDEENEPRVESALSKANAVLSFIQAPYEPPSMAGGGGGRPHGTWGGGGGWPGGGLPGGGIGFPGGGPLGRSQGGYGGDPSHTAGTADVAQDSGGDTVSVDDASALQDTLERLRQRYALYFYVPGDANASGTVRVDLSQEARLRYLDAEIHSRRIYLSGGGGRNSGQQTGPTVVTKAHEAIEPASDTSTVQDEPTTRHRSRPVNDDSGPRVNTVNPDSDDSNGSSSDSSSTAPANANANTQSKGWPKANPQSTPPQ